MSMTSEDIAALRAEAAAHLAARPGTTMTDTDLHAVKQLARHLPDMARDVTVWVADARGDRGDHVQGTIDVADWQRIIIQVVATWDALRAREATTEALGRAS